MFVTSLSVERAYRIYWPASSKFAPHRHAGWQRLVFKTGISRLSYQSCPKSFAMKPVPPGDSLIRIRAKSHSGVKALASSIQPHLTSARLRHVDASKDAVAPTVRSIIAGLDPNLPVTDVRSFEEVVSRAVAPQRFNAIVLGVFSGFALLLAMTGLYGVLSYSMSRRTAEIGLRVALGASGSDILSMTIGQGMRPSLLGIALGAMGAAWLSRYMTALLFGVKPFDLLTYFAVAILLLTTALLACYLPGRRAMGIDPAVALRIE